MSAEEGTGSTGTASVGQVKATLDAFRRNASPLMQANQHNFDTRLDAFLYLCERDIVMSTITTTLKSNPNVDVDEWHKDLMNSSGSMLGSAKFELPPNEHDQAALLYQLLLKIRSNEVDALNLALLAFGGATPDIALTRFIDSIVMPLIAFLESRVEEILRSAEAVAEASLSSNITARVVEAANSIGWARGSAGTAISALQSLSSDQLAEAGLSGTVPSLENVSETLENLEELFRKYAGRGQRAFGDVAVTSVREYYEKRGYTAARTVVEVDKEFKIDLVATRNDEVRGIQVKRGKPSLQDIRKIYKKGREYLGREYGKHTNKLVEVVASRFPENSIRLRDRLLESNGDVDLALTHSYIITDELAEYGYAWAAYTS